MREIEVKARVRDMAALEATLKKKGIHLSPALKQHDVVYGKPGATENAPDTSWLRVRVENGAKVYFTLKQSVVGHLDSIEHEVVVDDAAELKTIIKLIGFELYSDLTKVRRKAKYGDIELCVDTVPGLGEFIEAEKLMHHEAEHDEVIAELWKLLKELGVDRRDEVHEGYDVLERKKRGL